jgi:hypothetical protein
MDCIYNTTFSLNLTKWAKLVRVLNYTLLVRLAKDKCSSLVGPFVSYKENKVF